MGKAFTATDSILRHVAIAEHVQAKDIDKCWPWLGWKDKDGYGVARVGGAGVRAHRMMFAWFYGVEPGERCVMHTCDNPECVNPAHLCMGTIEDNNKDCASKGRTARGDAHGSRLHPERLARGESNGNHRLTAEQVLAIRASAEGAVALGRRYGVSRQTIRKVRLFLARKQG